MRSFSKRCAPSPDFTEVVADVSEEELYEIIKLRKYARTIILNKAGGIVSLTYAAQKLLDTIETDGGMQIIKLGWTQLLGALEKAPLKQRRLGIPPEIQQIGIINSHLYVFKTSVMLNLEGEINSIIVTIEPVTQAARIEQWKLPNLLTPRENDVVKSLLSDQTTQVMAARLGVDRLTVQHHIARICVKLGVHSRVGIVSHVLRLQLSAFIKEVGE